MIPSILKRVLFVVTGIIIICVLLIVIPSQWSGMNPEKPPLGYHFIPSAFMALSVGLEELVELKPSIPAEIEEIKNIEYKNIDGKSLQLDICRPRNLSKPAPLLVFVHGGGWKGGKRSDYLFYLVDFAKRGYITATVSYRLLSDGPYPACVNDVSDAVTWFFSHGEEYGYDTTRIALIGGSAGAHLVMLAAYGLTGSERSSDMAGRGDIHKIKAVVDIYGPADLTTEYARNHTLVTSFIAKTFEEAPELYKEASPIIYLDKDDPPTLILHGTSDKLVPISQSERLKEKADSLGVPCVMYRLPLWPHTMDIVKRVNDYCQLKMVDFFKQYLD